MNEPDRRLDRKLRAITEGRYTPDDFVLADAKDADMGFGPTAAGAVEDAPEEVLGPGRYQTRERSAWRPWPGGACRTSIRSSSTSWRPVP